MSIEDLANALDRVVVLGCDVWRLILYGVLSPWAPRVLINGIPRRNVMHCLLVGDVSTAKSLIHRVVEAVAPKAVRLSKTTEPSFEGVKRGRGRIEDGIVDLANNGVLIVPERG